GSLTVNAPFTAEAILKYGATDPADQTKHLHFDATGYPGIVLNVVSASQPVWFVVALFSLEGGAQQNTINIFHINGPGQYVQTYSVGSLNLANISAVSLAIPGHSAQSGSFVVDSFGFTTAVPEPAGYALIFGIVALAAGVAIRQKPRE